MPSKTQNSYQSVLSAINEIAQCSPRKIITDFERAAINAFGAQFPESQINCCYYHLQECNYSHLQQLDINFDGVTTKMSNLYQKKPDFAIDMRLFGALAFVPIDDVFSVFDLVVNYLQEKYSDKVNEYIVYFQNTYIGQMVGLSRANALFDRSLWNLHNSVQIGDSRTNNSVEGHNNSLRLLAPGNHLTMQRFVTLLKEDMVNASLKINEVLSGVPPDPQRKKYRNLSLRIKNIVEAYDMHDDKIHYLKQVASIFIM